MARYWRRNVTVVGVLLAVWAFVGLGCGVLFADVLARFRIGGFPVGFWFAQQGSILVFVVLILLYCVILNRIDDDHRRELDAIEETARRETVDRAASRARERGDPEGRA